MILRIINVDLSGKMSGEPYTNVGGRTYHRNPNRVYTTRPVSLELPARPGARQAEENDPEYFRILQTYSSYSRFRFQAIIIPGLHDRREHRQPEQPSPTHDKLYSSDLC